jgi:hypothetical protein
MDDFLSRFEQILGWVPQWLVGLGLVVGAIVVALFVHGIVARVIKRALGERWPAVTLLLQRIAGPARLALCLVAVALVLPLAPLNDVLREQLRHFFIVAVIALIGWITVRAVDMGAARYLQRFRLDTDENFLARKHVTQVRVFKRVIDTLDRHHCGLDGADDLRIRQAIRRQPVRLRRRRRPDRRPCRETLALKPDRRRSDRDHPADPDRGRRHHRE